MKTKIVAALVFVTVVTITSLLVAQTTSAISVPPKPTTGPEVSPLEPGPPISVIAPPPPLYFPLVLGE